MKIDVNKEDLEKSLAKEKSSKDNELGLSKQEEIAFHKGCLNTLVGERNELIKMIANVEAIMQAHIKRLEELGVKIQAEKKK